MDGLSLYIECGDASRGEDDRFFTGGVAQQGKQGGLTGARSSGDEQVAALFFQKLQGKLKVF